MSWRLRALFGLTLALLTLALPVFAQPSVSTRVSTRRPEVGESFRVQLTVLSDTDDMPSSPSLVAPPGVSVHGPSVTSQQQVSIAAGQIIHRRGITATWTLVAQKVGRFAIGPPTAMVAGKRIAGDRVTIEVVPAGQGQRAPFDPLDPLAIPGMPPMPKLPPLFGGDDDEEQAEEIDGLPPYPDELRVVTAPDPYAFLRAVVTPNRVVVGEQVTLKIYAYGRQGPFREASTSEPSRADFLAHTIVENSYGERAYRVPIDGQVWFAQKVRELALFPIRSGTLTIGPMKMGFEGRGYPAAGGKGLTRESEVLKVVVVEPPIAGRPPGYRLGDVGHFTLSANVEPREVLAGESISVVATLEGTGNVPFKLRVPQQRGIEWLEPTIVDDVEVRGSTVGGTRKFTYVVRMREPGRIELAELDLPYWDPQKNVYEIARASLGAIEVKPNPKASSAASDRQDTDRLSGLLTLRKALGPEPAASTRWSDTTWFWLLLLAGPLGVVVSAGGIRLARSVRERRARSQKAAGTIAGRALSDARKTDDVRQAAGHVERALVAAIDAATALKARGILRDQLASRLESAGVATETAAELRALLDDCDTVRFTGAEAEASDLVSRADAVIKALGRRGNGRAPRSAQRTPSERPSQPEPERRESVPSPASRSDV